MDLSYFNARVRGLRGRLFGPAEYEALIKLARVQDCIARLRSTHYGPYIERAAARVEGAWPVVSLALATELSETFALVWNTAPGRARPLLKAVLSYWEVYNLKVIIRGLSRGVKKDELRGVLLPAGEFGAGPLAALLGARSIEDLLGFLESWASPYAAPLRAAMPGYLRHKNVVELELALDKYVHALVLAGAGGRSFDSRLVARLVAFRVDAANTMTLLKIAGEGFSREGALSVFIEGGTALGSEAFAGLGTLKTRDEVVDGLLLAVSDPMLKGVVAGADPEDPASLEEHFDEAAAEYLRRTAVTEPLSIALGLHYLYAKTREIRNLRFITRSKLFGIPSDELSRYVLYRR